MNSTVIFFLRQIQLPERIVAYRFIWVCFLDFFQCGLNAFRVFLGLQDIDFGAQGIEIIR